MSSVKRKINGKDYSFEVETRDMEGCCGTTVIACLTISKVDGGIFGYETLYNKIK